MKYLSVISLFFVVFLSFPSDLEAIVASKDVAVESVFELGRNDLLELDRSALQQKIGRKLKFKERIALKLVKRKLRKYAHSSGVQAEEATKANGMAVAGFVLGLVSLLVAGVILGTLAIIFSAIALNKIRMNPGMGGRGLAIAGLILGVIGVVGALVYLASVT